MHYETQNEFNYPKNLRKFRGRETKNIENVLPSPLPLFLRGGKLILTNKHETRTSLLNNKFTIIAGMKDGKAEGELLVAESYSTDSEIEECEKLGCNMLIKLTQKGDE